MPAFPLPNNHCFALGRNPTFHGGRTDLSEQMHIRTWEDVYRQKWDRGFEPEGLARPALSEAALRVQREFGLVPTGHIDWDTWHKVFEGPYAEASKSEPRSSSEGSPSTTTPRKAVSARHRGV